MATLEENKVNVTFKSVSLKPLISVHTTKMLKAFFLRKKKEKTPSVAIIENENQPLNLIVNTFILPKQKALN